MTQEKAKNFLYRICGCKPDYLFAEKVVEIIKNLGTTIEEKDKQLTEAKKIIREYLKATESWNYDFADVLKCNKKAQAFLNKE